MAAQNKAQTSSAGFLEMTSDKIKRLILIDLARRYKGKDPIVDARIDANASKIMGMEGISSIPALPKTGRSVPFYLEGEPGVGKTSVIKAAVQEFCEMCGLNFVENPQDGYVIKPDDFYFAIVNLSGKNNVMDLGGIPHKKSIGKVSYLDETVSSLKNICSFAGLNVKMGADTKASLRQLDIMISGDSDTAIKAVSTAIKEIGKKMNEAGVPAPTGLNVNDQAPTDRMSYLIKPVQGGVKVTFTEQIGFDNENSHVTAMLPNLRFKLAESARFALFNFDDAANASPSIRNALLEIAQSGRYSGVADLNGAMVTFTGNIGAEDNTNTMSQQSDAEITRVQKYRVMDTPKDWARRETILRSNDSGNDCLFASFIEKQGDTPGIFRPIPGSREKKGVAKPNSRSLQNALNEVQFYFALVEENGLNGGQFGSQILDEIRQKVQACCGELVATHYVEHVRAMQTEAIPIASDLMKEGKFDEDRFERNLDSNSSKGKDFGYRFASALADEFIQFCKKSTEEEKRFAAIGQSDSAGLEAAISKIIETASYRMTTGISRLDPSMASACVARISMRLLQIESITATNANGRATVKDEFFISIGRGFSKANADGVAIWNSEEDVENVKDNICYLLTGSRGASKNTKTKKA